LYPNIPIPFPTWWLVSSLLSGIQILQSPSIPAPQWELEAQDVASPDCPTFQKNLVAAFHIPTAVTLGYVGQVWNDETSKQFYLHPVSSNP